ncbi:MAG: kdpD [Hyphomicrobiales bacterium]|nr:kdpD [Hyphomicrobiales bacterium]
MLEPRTDRDARPSPEALLRLAEAESRGKLRIFLGAAPGVGKTYEMLIAAQARRKAGTDVVVGVVETHGRVETQALLAGLEQVPKLKVPYRGQAIEEMDLDGIIARQPALVLVDELAHTNAPGSRHPKRYQDVEELLDRGIDVYTTVNIQHLESLNDVVARITSVQVRETVPDSILDEADEIEVVDLTPNDLIQRLKEGKVYVSQTAERALTNFFSPGNLTALRELAFRRAAQRVDEQLVTHMRANAIPGPWAAGERVLVCIDEGEDGPVLVRYARRMATRMQAPWSAIHVETGRRRQLSEAGRDRVAHTMRFAERLGAEAVYSPGFDAASEILDYAAGHNIMHIVVGKPSRSRLMDFLFPSAASVLMRTALDLSIHVVPLRSRPVAAAGRRKRVRIDTSAQARSYALSAAFSAVSLGIAQLLQRFLDVRSVALVFLVAVLFSAVRFGLVPALFSALLGALAFNFFFLAPLYTFTIGDPESIVVFVVYIVVAVIASNLTSNVRSQALTARQRARTAEDLFLFSRKLAGAGSLDDVLWATAFQIASMLKVHVVILLSAAGELTVRAGYPPEDMLDSADMGAAKWAWKNEQEAGRGADTLPGARRLFIPLRTSRGVVGVVGVDNDSESDGRTMSPEDRRLLNSLLDQAAIAIERVNLVEDSDRAKLAAESDRLRGALLTSISHDLKTPLAAVMGAAGTLREFNGALSEEDRRDLLQAIYDESERLHRFIDNLLNMTKLESGAIELNAVPYDLRESIGTALRRCSKMLTGFDVAVEMAPDLPLVALDPVLFEQVLVNLFENASKYAKPGSELRVQAWRDAGEVVVQVLDEGPGIPPDDVERIFEKFYRAEKGDRVRAGTGLGLPICRGFVEALGGTIKAENRTDRTGAVFSVRLPAIQDFERPPLI